MKVYLKHFLFLVFYFSLQFTVAKNVNLLDSLNNLLSQTQDTGKGKIYYQIAKYYASKDTVNFRINLNKAMQYAEKFNESTLRAKCYSTMGRMMHSNGDNEKAKYYFRKALQLDKEVKNLKFIASDYSNLGNIEYLMSNYDLAIQNYFLAQGIFDKLKDEAATARNYTNLGNAYLAMKQSKKALYFQKMAVEYFKKVKENYGIAVSLSNLADVYITLNNERKVRDYYEEALSLLTQLNDSFGIALVKTNLSQSYLRSGLYQKALAIGLEAIEIDLKIKDPLQIARGYVSISSVYRKLGQYENAIETNKKAYSYARRVQARDLVINALNNFAEIYKATNDYKKALEYQIKCYSLEDSINSRETADRIADITGKYESGKKEEKIKSLELDKQIQKLAIAKSSDNIRKQRYILFLGAGVIILMILFLFSLNKSNAQRKRANNKLQNAYNVIEEKKKEITDSIAYAKRLQDAILPPQEHVSEYFKENFILYQPKDIVAGDFYWMEHSAGLSFIAAADSTGHGVPGAMVSVVCSNALNRALKEFNAKTPGEILDKTRELVLETFEKSTSEVKDGMDISLLCHDQKNNKVYWSGANNPLWYISNNELKEIKANKQAIGKTDSPLPFTTHEIKVEAGTSFFLFTDGYADQFGGSKGKKFKYKQLEELLLKNVNDSMQTQKEKLIAEFKIWKDDLEQVDDVCIIGLRI